MNSNRYNKFSVFLKNKFGGRVKKICVDGGFSCPNRNADGSGGCTFCGVSRTSSEPIGAQVRRQLGGQGKYAVYFQNYTSTYADVDILKAKYDEALCFPDICALAIATRPDCITNEISDLIASYSEKYYVWAELGLQTSNDHTAKMINRGYSSSLFLDAANILASRGIDVVAHLIFGLQGETDSDIDKTVDFVNQSRATGVKIHSLYITDDNIANNQNYAVQTFEQYTSRVVRTITRLRPDIIIHRITGDAPRGKLIAPEWGNRKKLIRNEIERQLELNNLKQGSSYNA